ncbi:MAG: quinone-dependent dihydroorotate dehydrogenase [Pseudomonadales bacterium]
MYHLIRPLLFALEPERAHDLAIAGLSAAGPLLSRFGGNRIPDPVELMGVRFANRVGLAAGLDKNARCMQAMQALGFGFIEVGTVTPLAQAGNPAPRMFRLTPERSIINRMGFNNAGLAAMLARLRKLRQSPLDIPLGVNLGKNKATPAAGAVDDYLQGLDAVYDFADYITINLSSPNTPGLRDLQFGAPLDALLAALVERRKVLAGKHSKQRPLLVKIAPDMADDDLLRVSDRLVHFGIDGVIATNTTIDRTAVPYSAFAAEAGGLSGAALYARSTRVVEKLAAHLQGALVIVGVGGIDSEAKAVAKLAAGADLVQLYSGLIYEGPALVRRCAVAAGEFARAAAVRASEPAAASAASRIASS